MQSPAPSSADPSFPQSLAARFPGRALHWQLPQRLLELSPRPLVMGILNVTPDSFSDGGRFVATQAAIDRALELVAQGADILDIGGESTRPYSDPVDIRTELARVLPVLEAVRPHTLVPLSIDTTKAEVAEAAMSAGAEIINDISALTKDPRMIPVAMETQAAVCAMHMQGNPQTMQDNPTYDDVVAEVHQFLRTRRNNLTAVGIPAARIALDPGIGFGKTHQHNLTLAAHAYQLHDLGCPLLIGHSRKAFIGKVLGDKDADRTAGTVGIALALAAQGVQIIRVHDVAAVRQALLLFEATGGIDGQTSRIS
jgi:dihydropteroate synthase